jgi:hypothetical protein
MASKRGPLSKAEVFYITEHAKTGKDINDIALDLDRTIKSIEKCYTKAKKEISSKSLTAGEQFAKHKGSIVMTENASTISDARRKVKVPQSKQKLGFKNIEKINTIFGSELYYLITQNIIYQNTKIGLKSKKFAPIKMLTLLK